MDASERQRKIEELKQRRQAAFAEQLRTKNVVINKVDTTLDELSGANFRAFCESDLQAELAEAGRRNPKPRPVE